MSTALTEPETDTAMPNAGNNSEGSADAASRAQRLVENKKIEYLRFTYVCNDGVPRSKTTYLGPYVGDVVLPSSVGLSVTEQLVTELDDSVIAKPPIDATGDVLLVPDWSSVRWIPYRHKQGRVFGHIVDGPGCRWTLCPRSFLESVIERAGRMGIYFRVAFENEFYLLKQIGKALVPIDGSVYAQDDAFSRSARFLQTVAETLALSDITPFNLHAESGPGQFEISINPSAPLTSADDQIVLRTTIRDMAADRELLATFLPRPVSNSSSSGAHINISIWTNGENITGAGDYPSEIASYFLAGIIQHLPALVAITCPTESSYDRLRPGMWSGAYSSWGKANKEAAIRVPYLEGGPLTRFEYRSADPTCNPYLALGAIISAGLHGVDERFILPPEAKKDLPTLSARELRTSGITLLPQSLETALRYLAKDDYLRAMMGQHLQASYIAVRREQSRRLRRMSAKDRLRTLINRF